MNTHTPETELALLATRDLSWHRQIPVRWHVSNCGRCRELVAAYRLDEVFLRGLTVDLPPRLPWDRLSVEMTANIRVGLAAGECVGPYVHERHGIRVSGWRVATAVFGVGALMSVAWWLNTPAKQTQSLGRAVKAIASRPFAGVFANPFSARALGWDDPNFVVRVTTQGIELHENGTRLGVTQGSERPVAVTLNVKGSARARYVDQDTGQVTITSVYAQ